MFNRLMLLLPFALLTNPWKFYTYPATDNQREGKRTATAPHTHLGQDILIKMRLERAHLHPQDPLALRRQRRQHVPLEPPQHQRLELLVQFLDLLLVVCVAQVELVRQLDCSREGAVVVTTTETDTQRGGEGTAPLVALGNRGARGGGTQPCQASRNA